MPRSKARKDPKIGARLRARREELGLSQKQAVEGSGLTAAYLSRIEQGARVPTFDALRALAPKLRTTPEWLETGVGSGNAFRLHVDLGDEGMATPIDLAETLVEIAGKVARWGREGVVADAEGNTVGRWSVDFDGSVHA